ncbi:hypothetical protein BH10BAC5_BH10BAC5_07250 [soil metagenome]
MKTLILSISVITCFLAVSNGFSQDKPEGVVYSTAEVIFEPVPDPAVSEIVSNINLARINEDRISQEFWEAKLNEITKPQIIQGSNSGDLFGISFQK